LVHLRVRPARPGQGKRTDIPARQSDLADEIEKRIKEKLGIGARVDAPAEEAAATPAKNGKAADVDLDAPIDLVPGDVPVPVDF